MACPYFVPLRRHEAELWQFRNRLPLGDGYTGYCSLRGEAHAPSAEELKEHCNLGYARHCPWLPANRFADTVRFAVARESEDSIRLHYACERNHLPADCGALEYLRTSGKWIQRHQDECIQRLAECYIDSWLRKRGPQSQLTET
jgi:hypothetical protein